MTTEDKILDAARAEFLQQGYAATRMRAIADKAEINKGLLHYYFKSKDALFIKVFESSFAELMQALGTAFSSDVCLFEKIDMAVDTYTAFFKKNPHLPAFVLHEVNRHPNSEFLKLREKGIKPPSELFFASVEEAIAEGLVRPEIKGDELLVNIISLMVFPVLSRPMTCVILSKTDLEYSKMMDQRAISIKQFIKKAIQQ